jgi:hypothetical protein
MVKDEVMTDDKVWRVRFRPVATISDYETLVSDVRRIFSVSEKEALQ